MVYIRINYTFGIGKRNCMFLSGASEGHIHNELED